MNSDVVQRLIGTAALILAGWQIGSLVGPGHDQPRNAMLGIAAGAVIGFAFSPLLISWPYRELKHTVALVPLLDLVFAVLGLILGLVVAALLAYPLSFLPWWFGRVLPAVAAAFFAYLGVTLILMRRRELTAYIAGRSWDRSGRHVNSETGFLVDTSAIIDGRIADISETGFLLGPLLVPRFVLHELQRIAGSADPLRRNRGRRGLDILNRLQKESTTPVNVCDVDARDIPDVDGKLVKLAKDMGCPVVTNDFNLNRVAELQGVRVLNVNVLANAIKPVVLPGEEMGVRIIQEGKEMNQGLAYLDDGTMIVVENGRRFLNHDLDVTVTRVLQTAAGRMIFAHPKSNGHE